ncbi:MAG TPA: CBS domain-containing protein [Candidatus Omnitrophota bacterium]|nr:CBS domain-containing protein [Candidatus Omnitrophota bacterium]HPS36259.1 CBS domain-containing protein [Candidatus Omnitrophota bacterium]
MNSSIPLRDEPEHVHFLSEIVGTKVFWGDRKIGKLADFVIVDKDKVAEVTHFYIARPFGDPSLLIPWEKIESITYKGIQVDIEDMKNYETNPPEGAILLKDYILDKKVLDIEGREVEVVYDVRMVLRNKKFYISGVDLSRYGFLRRIGLKGFANFVHSLAFSIGARSLYSEHMKGFANFLYGLANKVKDRTLPWTYIQPLPEQISSFKGDVKLKVLKEKLADMPPVDLADILEELDHDQRVTLFDQLDMEHASDTLEEIDPNVQRALVSSMKKEKVAQLINDMTPGQAADILSALPLSEAHAILKLLDKEQFEKVSSIVEKQDEKALNYATMDILKFRPETTTAAALDEYQKIAKGKNVIMYLYVVDSDDRILGIIDLTQLLLAQDNTPLKDVMIDQIIALKPDSTLKEASAMFIRYGFRALPIIDEDRKILGVVPYRDVMNLKHRFVD